MKEYYKESLALISSLASLLAEICQLFGKSVAEDAPAIRHQWAAAVVHRFMHVVLNKDLENRSRGVFKGVGGNLLEGLEWRNL